MLMLCCTRLAADIQKRCPYASQTNGRVEAHARLRVCAKQQHAHAMHTLSRRTTARVCHDCYEKVWCRVLCTGNVNASTKGCFMICFRRVGQQPPALLAHPRVARRADDMLNLGGGVAFRVLVCVMLAKLQGPCVCAAVYTDDTQLLLVFLKQGPALYAGMHKHWDACIGMPRDKLSWGACDWATAHACQRLQHTRAYDRYKNVVSYMLIMMICQCAHLLIHKHQIPSNILHNLL